MTLEQLQAYRNEIIRQRDYMRQSPDWLRSEDAIECARAVLGVCYIGRAIAVKENRAPAYVRRFTGVPRPPVKARHRAVWP